MELKRPVIAILLLCCIANGSSQEPVQISYKQIDTVDLHMIVYSPESINSEDKSPAMVFFFGGGWNSGTTSHFSNHAEHFSQLGIVCFLVDYRVNSRQHTSPFESLKDAKSAMRYIREHANDFQIDPGRIIASGGSAGGHLAAATALVEDFNESSDDLSISCVPNALVLFNPVIDNGPGGYGYERIGSFYKDFSPLHNIKKGAPPTIIFLGTQDKLIPLTTAEYYKTVMEKVGSRCDLKLYEGEGHGFFNYAYRENYTKTLAEAEQFLISLGYIIKEK